MNELPEIPAAGPGVAVVVDFDNTLTTADIGDLVADRFTGPSWREVDERFRRGAIPLRELLAYMFGAMKTTPEVLTAFATEHARLRPGARAFLRAARELALPVVLASGGLEIYIRAILGEDARGLHIVCNRAHFTADGHLEISFPGWTTGCGHCGNCKAEVVRALRARGARLVVAVGDGTSDHCMAREADHVLGRGSLVAWARAHEPPLAITEYEDFADVAREVSRHVPSFWPAFERRWSRD